MKFNWRSSKSVCQSLLSVIPSIYTVSHKIRNCKFCRFQGLKLEFNMFERITWKYSVLGCIQRSEYVFNFIHSKLYASIAELGVFNCFQQKCRTYFPQLFSAMCTVCNTLVKYDTLYILSKTFLNECNQIYLPCMRDERGEARPWSASECVKGLSHFCRPT